MRRAKARNSSGPRNWSRKKTTRWSSHDAPDLGHDRVVELGRRGRPRRSRRRARRRCGSTWMRAPDRWWRSSHVVGEVGDGHRRGRFQPRSAVRQRRDIVSNASSPARGVTWSQPSSTDAVLVAVDGPIRIVTLNRPDTLNAADAGCTARSPRSWAELARRRRRPGHRCSPVRGGQAFERGRRASGCSRRMVDDPTCARVTMDEGQDPGRVDAGDRGPISVR